MRCPKCGHQQDDETRCEACGIYFAKYAQYLQRKQELDEEPELRRLPTGLKLGGALLAIALVVGLIWFAGQRGTPPAPPPPASNKSDAAPTNVDNAADGRLDLRRQLAEMSPAANVIEQVRNATVLVETSWGSGSGFFISDDCRILTNRHVVKLGGSTLSRAEDEMAQMRRSLDEIRRIMEERKKQFYDRCTRCDDQAYRAYMEPMEKQAATLEEQMQRRGSQLAEARLSEIRVVLADGSQHPVILERESPTIDLALLRLRGAVCPAVTFGDESRLAQGETLYTVGNPIGLKFTVTSGIFSGHFRDMDIHLLQTDAPINPGNSGGPLFDKQGRVVGVNTLIAAQAQGIGFAIPISVASAEFGL